MLFAQRLETKLGCSTLATATQSPEKISNHHGGGEKLFLGKRGHVNASGLARS